MRRLVFPVILASGLVMLGAVPASAEPAPAATSAKAAAGKKVCKITSDSLPELSGIVATKNGFVVVNDGADVASQKKIFFLDDQCEITKRVDYSGNGPRDTEDLVLSPDGKTIWIADIGDNNARDNPDDPRATIGLWSMPVDGSKEPKIHRLAYPDGDKHDAEALLINGDGTPVIVTKETVGKPAGLYVPTAALKTNNDAGVKLKKAGEVVLPRTDTAGIALARLAQGIVTGGAVAPDGAKVVLRTYLDAFEWDVPNGDVVAALKGKPRQTGLPNEPFGEAITYSADGKQFYTVSDIASSPDPEAANYILRYTPATKVVEANAAADGKGGSDDSGSWYSDLSLTDITYLVGGVGVLGAILVGAGIFGIMRARKRAPPEPVGKKDDPTGPKPLDAETELLSVGGPPAAPVYGGKRPPVGAASGPVYGGKPAAPQKGAGVYGAGRPGQGQPPARPGQPPARPGQPAARPVQPPGRPAAQPPGQPPGRRPGGGGQPVPPGRVQPGRPGGGQQPGRPGQGGGQPARPAQPPARPGQGGGKPGGGVYGAPPPPATGRPPGGSQRPSGFAGPQGGGRQPGRPDGGMNNYANLNGAPRRDGRFDNPGYGRAPQGH